MSKDYKQYKWSPTEYHTWEWKDRHRYSLQNDLLKQYNFPLYYYLLEDRSEGDFHESIYEDRARSWEGFYKNVDSELRKKSWAYMSETELLKMLQQIYSDKNIVAN